jgi:2-haloacid dehalogenase
MSEIDFSGFDALTFDCYGTLIDWERGILNALQPVLAPQAIEAEEDELLERYAKHEAALEVGEYVSYREILARSLRGLCADFGFTPSEQEVAEFSESVGVWPAFPDSAAALRRLAERFKLGVITNCDDDLFARSNKRLGVGFDWIVSAQTARSYKPSLNNFEVAFDTIEVSRERILHVAQSLYHDHVPAKQLGLSTVWVNRRHDRSGFGATPEAKATPDMTVPDMRTLAELWGKVWAREQDAGNVVPLKRGSDPDR